MVAAGMAVLDARAPFVTKLVAAAQQYQAGVIAAFETCEPHFAIAVAREPLVDRLKEVERRGRDAQTPSRLELQIEKARNIVDAASAIDLKIVLQSSFDPAFDRSTEARRDIAVW